MAQPWPSAVTDPPDHLRSHGLGLGLRVRSPDSDSFGRELAFDLPDPAPAAQARGPDWDSESLGRWLLAGQPVAESRHLES